MKDFNISQADKIMLSKRAILEYVNDELKIYANSKIQDIGKSTLPDEYDGRTLCNIICSLKNLS